MADVHKIDARIALAGEPVPEVVAQLEEMLAEAKAGRLRGIAYVTATDRGFPRLSVALSRPGTRSASVSRCCMSATSRGRSRARH